MIRNAPSATLPMMTVITDFSTVPVLLSCGKQLTSEIRHLTRGNGDWTWTYLLGWGRAFLARFLRANKRSWSILLRGLSFCWDRSLVASGSQKGQQLWILLEYYKTLRYIWDIFRHILYLWTFGLFLAKDSPARISTVDWTLILSSFLFVESLHQPLLEKGLLIHYDLCGSSFVSNYM